MAKVLKVGLDIHGVIDAFPEKFKLLSSALIKNGAEVHIQPFEVEYIAEGEEALAKFTDLGGILKAKS